MYITMPEIHHAAAWHLLRSHLFIFFILPKSPIFLLHGEGGVDKNSVGVGNGVQHLLEGSQICQGFTAGKDEVTAGRDLIHGVDAAENGIQTEAGAVGILLFVDAEGAVIVAVVGNKDGDGSAAFPCLIGIAHIVQASLSK